MADIVTSTLRPGLLVALKTSVRGNIKYDKQEIEPDHDTEDGAREASWQTKRTISDAEEYEAARKVRNTGGAMIRKLCANSAFGLLCPEADYDALMKAVETAQANAKAFNETATLTRVEIRVMTGRVAPDDVQAIKAINSEIKELMDAMALGLKNMDVKAVREAASAAKQMGQMLNQQNQARVQIAVETARAAASAIVKAGDEGAVEIDLVAIRKITDMRTAFLDLDDKTAVESPDAAGAMIDLGPADPTSEVKATASAIEV